MAQLEVDAFEKFLALADYPCQSVRIPYEDDQTLPGYLCLNPNVHGPAPTIIFNEGKDGWAEDGKYVVDEGMKRGYNVLLFDAPGMGKTIRIQGLPFRHDWEKVMTPVIDYLLTIPEVDPDGLAHISVSLGGFLAPRAAVFEHRLKALIPNPGVLNWFKVYEDVLNGIDPGLLELYREDHAAFDAAIYQLMSVSEFMHWGLVDSMWHHGVDTPSALMSELERFNIEDMVQNITTATLVIDAEAEERGQAMELYNALPDTLNKAYVKFTADEAAQFHAQPGATAILSTRMFDWLDEIMLVSADDAPGGLRGADDDSSGVAAFRQLIMSPLFALLLVGIGAAGNNLV
jgi:pimeloyl-ACP methyl ester carboxylesterase